MVKGFTQQEGVDYTKMFSLMVKKSTVKMLLAIASSQNLFLHQLDINNAFLHGNLFKEVYMDIPLGYEQS